MKERFAKLLLGEDMSGCGNGFCTALAISNAITNICATLFEQIWRLEPVPPEKKAMWRREMEWLLSVSDHIVELIPSWQTFPDGSKLEDQTYWSKEAFGSLVPFPSTPYRIAFSTPNFSPAQLATPAKGDRSPFLSSSKVPQCRMGVKKVLTDYLNIDLRPKKSSNPNEGTKSGSTITQEASVSFECLKAAVSLSKLEPVPEKEP